VLAVTPLYPAITWNGDTLEDERGRLDRESGGSQWMAHFILTPVRQQDPTDDGRSVHITQRDTTVHDGVAHVSAVMERKNVRSAVVNGQTENGIEQQWIPTKLKVAVWNGTPSHEMVHSQSLPHGLTYTNFKLKQPARHR
jgi:hypothetical protein